MSLRVEIVARKRIRIHNQEKDVIQKNQKPKGQQSISDALRKHLECVEQMEQDENARRLAEQIARVAAQQEEENMKTITTHTEASIIFHHPEGDEVIKVNLDEDHPTQPQPEVLEEEVHTMPQSPFQKLAAQLTELATVVKPFWGNVITQPFTFKEVVS